MTMGAQWWFALMLTLVSFITTSAVTTVRVSNAVDSKSTVPCGHNQHMKCINLDLAISTILSFVELGLSGTNESHYVVEVEQASPEPVVLCNSVINVTWTTNLTIQFEGISDQNGDYPEISCQKYQNQSLLTIFGSDTTRTSLKFQNFTFSGIRSMSGGAVFKISAAGDSYLSLNRVNFDNISSIGCGGVIFVENSRLFIQSSRFNNCSSYQDGGSIYASNGRVWVSGAEFSQGFVQGVGGAISLDSNSSFEMVDIRCKNNFAESGGCLYVSKSEGNLRLCTFDHNGALQNGGGIALESGIMHLSEVKSTLDYAGETSGAFYINQGSFLNLSNSTVESSLSQYGACAEVSSSSMIVISDSRFRGNVGIKDSGCLFSYNSTAIIMDSLFINNTAYGSAGAIVQVGGDLQIETSTFKENQGRVQSGALLSLSLDLPHNFSCDKCTFMNNSTPTFGGAMYVLTGIYFLWNCSFVGNVAGYYGGAINGFLGVSTQVYILDSSFDKNHAEVRGGALSFEGGLLTVRSSDFKFNSAIESGGMSFFSEISSLSIFDLDCFANSANQGGGMFISKQGDLTIESVIFRNNTAVTGGSVTSVQSSITFSRVVAVYNVANAGGAVYVDRLSFISFENENHFENNLAVFQKWSPCGVYGRGGVFFIEYLFENQFSFEINSTLDFVQNHADVSGGTFFIESGSTFLNTSNMIFREDTASEGPKFGGGFASIVVASPLAVVDSSLLGEFLIPNSSTLVSPGDTVSAFVQSYDVFSNVMNSSQNSITITAVLLNGSELFSLVSAAGSGNTLSVSTVGGTGILSFFFALNSDIFGFSDMERVSIRLSSIPCPVSSCNIDLNVYITPCADDQILIPLGVDPSQFICAVSSLLSQQQRMILYIFGGVCGILLSIIQILCMMKIQLCGEVPELTAILTFGLITLVVAQILQIKDGSEFVCNLSKLLSFAASSICFCTLLARS
jgi:hypothetical protein